MGDRMAHYRCANEAQMGSDDWHVSAKLNSSSDEYIPVKSANNGCELAIYYVMAGTFKWISPHRYHFLRQTIQNILVDLDQFLVLNKNIIASSQVLTITIDNNT